MVQGELPTIDTGGEISSPNVPSGTGATKSKSKSKLWIEKGYNTGLISELKWKNRISSTTMKLRKSPIKPVTLQNISSCLVLPPEIVMHDAFNVILRTSANIRVIVHDDPGWKNRTIRYNCRSPAASLALRVIFVRRKRPPIYASCTMISGGRTEQHIVIRFGELTAVD